MYSLKQKELPIEDAIVEALVTLQLEGQVCKSHKWQAIASPDALFEASDLFIRLAIPHTVEELAEATIADLPWSENHFKERVAGKPANPGYEYQNWPYYRPEKHNSSFRAEGEGYFSHTYMERFWPDKDLKGTGVMGYKNGDFNDLIERLISDPGTRQAFFAIWHPQDQSNNGVRLPCTIGYHFTIRNNQLNVTYLIRSCDAFRHFKNDIYLTMRLVQYVASMVNQRTNLKLVPGTMHMWIGSFHCFAQEVPLIEGFKGKYINQILSKQ